MKFFANLLYENLKKVSVNKHIAHELFSLFWYLKSAIQKFPTFSKTPHMQCCFSKTLSMGTGWLPSDWRRLFLLCFEVSPTVRNWVSGTDLALPDLNKLILLRSCSDKRSHCRSVESKFMACRCIVSSLQRGNYKKCESEEETAVF